MEGLPTEQITLGKACPSFARTELLLLHIDGYISLKLVKDGEDGGPEVSKGHAKRLAVHKGESREGLRPGLGLTMSGRPMH
eukprot:9475498-Pyramimonas_sp.AAC.1